ncbi:uncharacterized protein EDB91DRAFT_1249705 [Suillus paluster]|uniref:uncharacterized protein n=1 Tax=Suillus paluster TaxID=48578 RepID=UPI001B87910D|nr:uncharacterized protein EDB91DRAFT_1249705 [Suillus paluster]KAG1737590.1 hypothetical protein EDB91DRAFT_1249705 [Suillus paluster]
MSFAAGSLAGALVMGGIYHGFSNLMQTSTVADIHTLSERLVSASTTIPSPPPASTRITYHPLTSLIQSKWNNEVAGLFGMSANGSVQWSWGRKFCMVVTHDTAKLGIRLIERLISSVVPRILTPANGLHYAPLTASDSPVLHYIA